MNRDNIEEILKSIGSEDVPAEVRKIAQETTRDFSEPLMRPKQHVFLEYIMKSQITKLAAAAVIIIAVLMMLNTIGTGDALAEVLEKIEQIKAFTYKMKMNMKDMPGLPEGKTLKMEMKATFAKDIGVRMTAHMDGKLISETYVLMNEGVILSIIPEQKQYMRITLTDEIFEKMQKENGDPRAMVKEFRSNEYTELGRSVIDGIEVEGYESTEPNIVQNMLGNVRGRLWVDVQTKLPIRFDIEVLDKKGEKTMEMSIFDFEWDIEVEADVFIVNIPDDYKLLADIEMGGDEKGIVEGLSLFAELTGGKYPSDLNMMTISQELSQAMITGFGGSQNEQPNQEQLQKLVNLQLAGAFYTTKAAEGKDPAYYGDKVTAEFPHAVLMRWEITDNTYRVIFGDLTIEEASSEELAELEALPLNLKSFAINPEPTDGTVGTSLEGIKLSWIPGAYAAGHRVYFGTSLDELALLAEVTEPNYTELPELKRETTYYWRVDEIQPNGSVVTGDIWSFYTGGLVAWWKLDDGTGDVATDSAGSGHDGTLVGDTTWTNSKIGAALVFDGNDDYVEIGKDPDFDFTNQITVTAWIKVNAFDRGWQAIIAKGDSSWRLQRNKDKNTLEFACTGLLVPGTRWSDIHGTVDVNDGQWHHIAGTYDGSQVCLYVDGTLDVSSKSIGGSIKINDQPVLIGENSETPKRFWNGLIDDVRVYNYGLGADEVAAIYTGQVKQK
jgi:outer membrane lipoprotein-sorting protein